jgi:uncharacterized protein (TIGR02444 family)
VSGTPSLWDFSLEFYARPGVAAACLLCQDEAGADVNLILFLLWQGTIGIGRTPAEIATLDEAVRNWREQVVKPLRSVRRYLKGMEADALRDAVKAAELDAERLQQQQLSAHARAADGQPAPDAAAANLRAYAAATGRALPISAVDALLSALGGGLSPGSKGPRPFAGPGQRPGLT